MERTAKCRLLAIGSSLLALTFGGKAGHAFDTVAWQWHSAVSETVTRTALIDFELTPTGMIFLEQNQINVGNVSAVSEIDGVNNNGTGIWTTEDFIETTSEMVFVDVDFNASLQIGGGNNDGANPTGAAKYGTDGAFTDPLLAGAQSHIALYALLQNNLDSIDYETSFVDEVTGNFEIYAYFDDLDLFMEIKGNYNDCTPGGANCTPTGDVELYRLSGDQKVFFASGTLNQQNGVDMVNTPGPGGEVKLSADFDGASEWQEIFTQIITQREIFIPTIMDALTDLPSVVSTATAVANNSTIKSNLAIQLDASQLAWGGLASQENPEPSDILAILAGSLGLIASGEVSAVSAVGNVLNVSATSTATAVVNNQQVAIVANSPADGLLLANVSQLSFNSVTAISTVSGLTLNSYLNLGLIERPLASSKATAVGNNIAFIVNTPI